MNADTLKEVLIKHKEWLDSGGENGRQANLKGTDLSYSNLVEADLSHANLVEADLSHADLQGVNLNNADLSGANLRLVYLRNSNLIGADLSGASLYASDVIGANLTNANFENSILQRANLALATIDATTFTNADLTEAQIQGENFLNAPKWENSILKNTIVSVFLYKTILDDLQEKYKSTLIISNAFGTKGPHLYAEFNNDDPFSESNLKSHFNYFSDFLFDFYRIQVSVETNADGNILFIQVVPKAPDTPLTLIEQAFHIFIAVSDRKAILEPVEGVNVEAQIEYLQEAIDVYHEREKRLRRKILLLDKEAKQLKAENENCHKYYRYCVKAKLHIKKQAQHIRTLKERLRIVEKWERPQMTKQKLEMNAGPGFTVATEGIKVGKFELGKTTVSTSLFSVKLLKED